MTARRKTRLVVRRGRIGVGGCVGSEDGREREKRSCGGANMDRVPVPVLHKLRYYGKPSICAHILTYPVDVLRSPVCHE